MNKGSIIADGPPRQVLTMDICEEIGVGIPKATQIYKRLKTRGVDIGRIPLTGKELASIVQEVHQS